MRLGEGYVLVPKLTAGQVVAGGCACLFLTQPEKVTQTRVVGTQRVQLAGETLHAANGYFSLSITFFGGGAYSRQRSPSAFAAVDTFMTRRRSRFLTGMKW